MSEFSPKESRTYLFGPFGLDAGGRWMMREGVALSLEPKALRVLALLVENRGRVVTKDELLQTLWPDTFVEEGILTVHISALRKALGLSANGQKYIRTVHKQGYQFTAGVREITTGNMRALLHPHFTNLPAQTTPFVGRVKEVENVYQLLANRETRLLTLIGPGGTGKTRLGIEVATRLTDAFVDGVFWIPLADLREPDQVISAILKALGGADSGGEAEREIEELLQGANVLLLLDNFEQVIHAGVCIAGLLAACPGLNLLITSREPLRVRGEQQFLVPPLDVTSLRGASSAEAVSQNEAARLFAQHARAVNNDFTLDDTNARDIAEICMRLDGIPLAIEFAATRAKFLPTARILEQLENRLSLLRDGALDLPARQRTMRDTISWSYDLLSDEEKRGFLHFSVFMGGATPEAAAAILNPGSQSTPSVLRLLSGLAEKSMLYVREQTASGPRFQMLEILREYAIECLEAREAEDMKRLHAEYFTGLAECARIGLHLSEQIEWLDRLDREHYNCMAVLRWCKEGGNVDIGARLCLALWKFWRVRGHLCEGRMWLEWLAVETSRDEVDPTFNAAILNAAAVSIYLTTQSRKDFHRARQLLEEGLAIYIAAGDNLGVLSTLNRLGGMAAQRGLHTQAQIFYKKGLRLARLLDDSQMVAISLQTLAR